MVRVHLGEISTCKLVNMCLEAFKYTLTKEIYYEIVQQWYLHRFSVSTSTSASASAAPPPPPPPPPSQMAGVGETAIKHNQLNLFLHLLLSLCGCFDMSRLELDLPFLAAYQSLNRRTDSLARPKQARPTSTCSDTPVSAADADENSVSTDCSNPQTTPSVASLAAAKRVKNAATTATAITENDSSASEQDWQFLLSDELAGQLAERERNLCEFDRLKLIPRINSNADESEAFKTSRAFDTSNSKVYS